MIILLLIDGFSQAEEKTTETKTLTIKLIPDLEIKFPDVPKKVEIGEQVVYLPEVGSAPKVEVRGLPSKTTNTAAPADWTYLIQKYFPFNEWQNAEKVMMCESGGRYDAVSNGNYGLFQINQVHRGRVGGDVYILLSPDINTRVASEIWQEQGWFPWRYSKDCHEVI